VTVRLFENSVESNTPPSPYSVAHLQRDSAPMRSERASPASCAAARQNALRLGSWVNVAVDAMKPDAFTIPKGQSLRKVRDFLSWGHSQECFNGRSVASYFGGPLGRRRGDGSQAAQGVRS
jgi:hypothetical protein